MVANDLPVYLFTGFLESGKTRFIDETLADERFNKGERTLVLLCEEGEEELDPSRPYMKHVTVEMIDDIEQLSAEACRRLFKKYRPERVLIEYNGMWQLQTLFEHLPQNWIVCQDFLFVEAPTFLAYNANMRSLVVDKLGNADLVVFNRFDDARDSKEEFHKIVRGSSRRADIAYEYADGHVEYDDIVDPLPFDVEAPSFTVKDEDYAIWYRDVSEDPDKYAGKTITIKAVAALDRSFPARTFALGRHVMTCCVEDIQFASFLAECDTMPQNHAWYMVTFDVEVRFHPLYERRGPVLKVKSLSPAAPPEQEVATFF
ncbi:MAG: GTPase [Clostridia bacterium]|nr:GTPase [Clostridia bacterium]